MVVLKVTSVLHFGPNYDFKLTLRLGQSWKRAPNLVNGYGGQERKFLQLCFADIYQVNDVCGPGGELPVSLPLPVPVLVRVDEEVDRAVEGGQKVAEAGYVRQPGWPDQLGLSCKIIH